MYSKITSIFSQFTLMVKNEKAKVKNSFEQQKPRLICFIQRISLKLNF